MNKLLDKYLGVCFFLISIIFSLFVIKDKRNVYIYKYYEVKNNENKVKMATKDIEDITREKIKLEKDFLLINNRKKELKENIDKFCITDNEFKKIMYNLANKANLQLEKITDKKTLDNLVGYKLNYSNICLKGDLIGLGKFLYYLNKIPYHIDTKYFSLSIKGTKQVINLGYVENGDLNE